MKYDKIALTKHLVYEIYPQWNNYPKFQVIDLVTKKVLYYGKSGYKARKIVKDFKREH